MKSAAKHNLQRGFTIIELMIATAVFSVIIVVITVSVLRFTNQYYRGVISSTTQNTARTIIDDVSRSLQFSSGDFHPLATANGSTGYCIGVKRYSYAKAIQVKTNPADATQARHGMVSDNISGCTAGGAPMNVKAQPTTLPTANATKELLAQNMRISKFTIVGSGELYVINVKVVYGDNDVLENPNTEAARCKSAAGSQFCSVSELTTTVKKRVF